MERTQVLTLMGELKLYGMRQAYDEVLDVGIKRQHEPPHIVNSIIDSTAPHARRASVDQMSLFVSKATTSKCSL